MKCKYCGQEYKKAEMYHISHGFNIHMISEERIDYVCGDCYFEIMYMLSKYKGSKNQDTDIVVNITDEDIDYQYTIMCIEDELDSIKHRYKVNKTDLKELVGELND